MKDYRLSFIVLLFLGITVAFSTSGLQSKEKKVVPEEVGIFDADNVSECNTCNPKEPKTIDIDIPLPLEGISEQILYRNYYVVSYNKDTRLPNWVAWHLTPDHTTGEIKRPGNAWHEDLDVPFPRATVADYKGSRWTHGHMCPAGDNKWDSDAI